MDVLYFFVIFNLIVQGIFLYIYRAQHKERAVLLRVRSASITEDHGDVVLRMLNSLTFAAGIRAFLFFVMGILASFRNHGVFKPINILS